MKAAPSNGDRGRQEFGMGMMAFGQKIAGADEQEETGKEGQHQREHAAPQVNQAGSPPRPAPAPARR